MGLSSLCLREPLNRNILLLIAKTAACYVKAGKKKMPCILVFKSRVDQEAIFGCEVQPHTGRNVLFHGVLLAAGLHPAWLLGFTQPSYSVETGHLGPFFLELFAYILCHPPPLLFRKKRKTKPLEKKIFKCFKCLA